MKLGLQHSARMEQRLVQSPQMIQAMQILQLSRMDLQERIEQELLENPFLEQAESTPGSESEASHVDSGGGDSGGRESGTVESGDVNPDRDVIADQFERWREFEDGGGRPTAAGREASDRKLEAMANTPDRPKNLAAALIDQLAMIDFTPLQRELAEFLIYSLDPRGYLPDGVEAVAQMFATEARAQEERAAHLEGAEAEILESPADQDSSGSSAAESRPESEDALEDQSVALGDGGVPSTADADYRPAELENPVEGALESEDPADAALRILAYRVLGRLRRVTHPALGARDLRESLALQLEARGVTDELLYQVVEDHLDDLMRNRLPHVAKATGADVAEIKAALEALRELDPSPGGEFGEEVAEAIVPDVFVALVEDELVVQLASDRLPPLQLSPSSEDLLVALDSAAKAEAPVADATGSEAPEAEAESPNSPAPSSPAGTDASDLPPLGDSKGSVDSVDPGAVLVDEPEQPPGDEADPEVAQPAARESRAGLRPDEDPSRWGRRRLEAARWFMEAVVQRERTVLRVARAVFQHQKGFLERGPKWLKPLRMQEIADETGVHISTVSRAVAGKHAQTPRGIFPLKYFFTSGTRDKSGTQASQISVQQRLQEIVEREDKAKPLSDDQLAAELERTSGIKIARRTVTKYRKALEIPSSSQRKQY